jgi:branched-chain amino acid transport system permease protein
MNDIVVVALSALTSVAILILISLGLAVIFGLMRIVNMAHGEFVMIGAFTVITLVRHGEFPIWLAILIAPIVSALIGMAVEILLIRPLYGRRLVDTLLVTFGLSLILFQVAVDIFGTTSPGISTPLGAMKVGNYSVSLYSSLVLPLMALVVMALLYVIFTRTKYGLLARATAQNPQMASSLGVYSRRVNLITFALGCALAGLSGGLVAPIVAVSPSLGQSYVAQAFMTVVTGGPAFLLGTVAASTLLGSVANIVSQIFTTLWGITALLFTAMVLIRLLPQGLSGSWRRQF